MNYEDYVVQNEKYLRKEEVNYLRGDSSEIRQVLGWKPKYTFDTMIDEMVEFWENKLK
jgi:GDPmannose 4,6-dehydratase